MFSGNQPPTKRRTPHGSFNRTGIPQPSTSSSSTSALIHSSSRAVGEVANESEEDGVGSSHNNNLNQNNNNDHAPLIPLASTSNLMMPGAASSSAIELHQVSYAYGAATSTRTTGSGSNSTAANNNTKKEIISNNTVNDLVQEDSSGRSTRSRSRSLAPEGNNEAITSNSKPSSSKSKKQQSQSREPSPSLSRTEPIVEITISSDCRKTTSNNGATLPRSSIPTSTSNPNINNTTNSRPLPGGNYPDGTSVNIATAFTQALVNEVGGSGSQISNSRGANRENRDVTMNAADEEEGEEEESGKETQNTGDTGNGDGNSRKRKKRSSQDPTFKQEVGELSNGSEDDDVEENTRAKAKRAKNSVSVEPTQDQAKRLSPLARRKTGDAAYKPSATSDLEKSSSSSDDERSRRRRSKGKRRASMERGTSQAIPIGRRDSEVWSGQKKKRKSRKSKKSGLDGELDESMSGSGAETGDGEGDGNEGEGEVSLGGYDYQPEDQEEVPQASYYLRAGSPQLNQEFTFQAPQSHSQSRNVNNNREPTIDPTFAAFDNSISNSMRRDDSYDSGIRGSSYDYSEEERIVAAIEAEKARELAEANARITSPSTSSSARKRKNRIPSPPRIMEPIEEEEIVEPTKGGRGLGRKMGEVVRPLVSVWRKTQNPLLDWWKICRAVGLSLGGLFVLSLLLRSPTSTSPISKSFSDYLPFLNRFNSPYYTTPDYPAESFDILVQRLAVLEKTMGQLSTLSESDRTNSEKDRNRLNKMSDQVSELEASVDQDRKRSIGSAEHLESISSKDSKALEKVIGEVKEDLNSLVSRVKALAEDRTADGKIVEALRSGVDSVGKNVASLETQVAQIAKDLKSGIDADYISRIALEAIEVHLPSKLTVRIDGNGNLVTAPAFWQHLKEAFVENKDVDSIINPRIEAGINKRTSIKDVEEIVSNKISAELAKLPPPLDVKSIVESKVTSEIAKVPTIQDLGFLVDTKLETQISKLPTFKDVVSMVNARVNSEVSKFSKPDPPKIPLKEPTWKDFLTINEETLRNYIESDIKGRLSSDAIVSKKTFLDLLQREIKALKVDFETKSNENVQKIGEELLSKVAKQEQMRKDSLIDKINPFTRPSAAESATLKSFDGQNISQIVSTLVDTALLKYSKDVLARPDYALGTAGGRIIPSLTSPTYEARPLGVAPKLIGWITGTGTTPGRPPVTALHPYNSPGYCWPFAGNQGQLGILLSRIVIPEDITLEHVSKDVAVDGDVSSAPKDFEVWGVVDGQEDIDRLREYREELLSARKKRQTLAKLLNEIIEEEEEPASSVPPTPSHILLAIGSYDITASSPVQTFPVTTAARHLGIPVGLVVVKILSNHGESHYTCLYRVRVSGISLAQKVKESGNGQQ